MFSMSCNSSKLTASKFKVEEGAVGDSVLIDAAIDEADEEVSFATTFAAATSVGSFIAMFSRTTSSYVSSSSTRHIPDPNLSLLLFESTCEPEEQLIDAVFVSVTRDIIGTAVKVASLFDNVDGAS